MAPAKQTSKDTAAGDDANRCSESQKLKSTVDPLLFKSLGSPGESVGSSLSQERGSRTSFDQSPSEALMMFLLQDLGWEETWGFTSTETIKAY